METWTAEDVQREIMKETQIVNGQEMVKIERMVEVLLDPRMPDYLKEKSTEMLRFLEKAEKELKSKE